MMNYSCYNPKMCMLNNNLMKINGVGTVKAIPDMAVINLGIVTEGISLKAAQEENAAKTTAVINMLYEMGIPKKQIRTSNYSIEPQYDYVQGKQIFKGYQVTNILSVTTTNLMDIGKIIDNATSSGANRIENISFSLTDTSVHYKRALNLAVNDAILKGIEIGTTLGVLVNKIPCSILEAGSAAALTENTMFKATAESTPILSGQLDITARIEAIFKYGENQ